MDNHTGMVSEEASDSDTLNINEGDTYIYIFLLISFYIFRFNELGRLFTLKLHALICTISTNVCLI
jgi:hypothetical protein